MKKTREVWIVVADGAKALFFAPNDELSALRPVGPAMLISAAAKLRARELKSDRPGRSVSSSRTGVRHAIEPKHDHHKMEKHRFTRVLSKTLDDALARGAFDDLVVVAPSRSLGELRKLLPEQVKACVQMEVPKDLTRESADGLWTELAPTVIRLCGRPRRARAA